MTETRQERIARLAREWREAEEDALGAQEEYLNLKQVAVEAKRAWERVYYNEPVRDEDETPEASHE